MVGQPNIPQSEESISDIKKLSEIRELRAKEILMAGKPKLLSEEEFLVPSSNGKDNYKVIHLDSWSCSCPDFKERCQKLGIYCKHIKALQLFLKLRNSEEIKDFDILQISQEEGNCPYCNSEDITKQGYRINKSGKKQKYKCNSCRKFFVNDPVKYIKGNAKLVCLAMDCYYKGLSLRDIKDTFRQFYNLNLHHETIRRWIVKFTEKINDYVETKTPELGKERWNTDEQNIKVGSEWMWSWNTIDNDTKFWIANNVTKGRSIEEARQQFKKVKKVAKEQKPELLITDGLHSYKKAIKKEFSVSRKRKKIIHATEPIHVPNAGLKKPINNNIVERLNGEFREFDKVRRGFKSKETAQGNLNGMRLYHNFIKPHQSLNGLTPSQKANIVLNLGNNKWLDLLKEGVKNE